MSSARLRRRVGPVIDHGWATLEGFAHRFDKRGNDGTGKGNVIRKAGSLVHGVLYQLKPAQLDELDYYEEGYTRIEIEVTAPGGALAALTYSALEDARDAGLEPSSDYLAHYLRGAEEHGLPRDYVRELSRLLTVG